MIKDTLKRIRKEKGYTQDDVADFLNVKRQTYSSYERGISLPDIETIKKLTYFFNVSINELAESEPFENIKEKDPHNNSNYAGNEICKKLVEIGFLKEGEPITEKHLEVLAEVLAPQVEFFRFKLNQKQ